MHYITCDICGEVIAEDPQSVEEYREDSDCWIELPMTFLRHKTWNLCEDCQREIEKKIREMQNKEAG